MSDLRNNAIINVFKPSGVTSQGVVTAVKRALGIKTAGHCGTLDPLATGVLPVMTGRGVKASEYLVEHDKLYEGKMLLGVTTDTGDVTGNIIRRFDGKLPEFSCVLEVLPMFTGEIVQTPPMYSALKVNGRKLVDLARQGIEVERKGRSITVYSLSAKETEDGIVLNVLCSRGTYIRTLIEDIGNALGCGATMSALCRKAVGNVKNGVFCPMFHTENSVPLEWVREGNVPDSAIIATEDVFDKYPKLSMPPFYNRLFSNGCEIYVSKLENDSPAKNAAVGDVFRVYDNGVFFALGEAKQFENGIAIKQIKRF